ncbi:MAG: response regulator transcription factor [Pseudomonadota bacterium]
MKIILADDHALFREGARHLLQQLGDGDIEVLEAATCQEAIIHADLHEDIDLALLDLHMPGVTGVECVVHFQTAHPEVPVVVLSGSESRPNVQAVLDVGALGYIPKSSSSQVMLSAIRLVLSGGIYLPPLVMDQELNSVETTIVPQMASRGPMPCCLTERQMDVLKLLAAGKPNKLIARELGLGEGTIKVHLAGIFRALEVNNRTEAVMEAQRRKLL